MTSPNDVQIIFNLNIYCSIASDFAGKFREEIGESFRERNHIMKRSFSELLGNSGKVAEVCASKQQEMKDAVFSLINQHQDLDKLVVEATHAIKINKEIDAKEIDAAHSVDGLFSALKDQAMQSAEPLSAFAATICAKRISAITSNKSGDDLLLSEDEKSAVLMVIEVIKKVQQETGFNRASFVKAINNGESLPIELVWQLHLNGIMTLDAYIKCNLNSPGVIGGFPLALINLSKCEPHDETVEIRKQITKGILSFLVVQGYCDKPSDGATSSKGMKKVAAALLDTVAKKVLVEDGRTPAFCIYEVVTDVSRDLEHETIRSFSTRQISVILRRNPVHTVSEALQQQNQWTYAKAQPWMTDIFTNLLLPLEPEEALSTLSQTLEEQEVNWMSSLTFLATFLVLYSQAPGLIQDKVASLLAVGLDTCEMDSLILAFLLARQAALEGPHIFPTYQDWYGRTFGDLSHSPASSRKSFSFLMKFLTDIVPYDDVISLKAHIHRPAAPPPTCRPLLSDYIILAKTRLQDLQIPIDDAAIYDAGQTSADKEKIEKQSEQDVEMALAAFEKTGKVPSSVMESSIFRKPYFIGRFLPVLLKPRPLPDDPDLRMKFISSLHRAEKIPSSLYNKYEKACQKISTDLLEGILSDDDSMEDLLLSPNEQLENALNTLTDAVIKIHNGEKTKIGVSGHVSIISEKVTALLAAEAGQNNVPAGNTSQRILVIDVSQPAQSANGIMIADCALEAVCKVLTSLSSSISQQGSWLQQLLLMLSHHEVVWTSMLYKLWMLLLKHGAGLATHHINGLAAVVVHLASEVVKSHTVRVKDRGETSHYIDTLLHNLPTHNQDWMRFTLRFCTSYIQHAVRTFPEFTLYYKETQQAVIPPAILTKFRYLLNRLCPESRNEAPTEDSSAADPEMVLPVALFRSELVSNLMLSASLSFTDWVRLELQVFSHDDVLSCWQRQDYSQWIIGSYSLKKNSKDSYTKLCSELTHGLLDYDLSLHDIPPACTCQGSDHLSTQGNSRDHMISLLQLLLPSESPSHQELRDTEQNDVTDVVPWLREVQRERKERLDMDEYSIARHLENMSFYRLVRMLYPAFYRNKPLVSYNN